MIEIIVLYFLSRHIGTLAVSKGLKPFPWKIYTIVAWMVAEFLGMAIGIIIFDVYIDPSVNARELVRLMLFGLTCAFGGYLLVRRILESRPDQSAN
ncbi:MAG: hypothetical protein FGM46_00600 [Ferruginibacter sp.]|nr:hypothetical protein [Ferruginibacter sp.]